MAIFPTSMDAGHSWYPPSGLIYIPLLEAMQAPDMILCFPLQMKVEIPQDCVLL